MSGLAMSPVQNCSTGTLPSVKNSQWFLVTVWRNGYSLGLLVNPETKLEHWNMGCHTHSIKWVGPSTTSGKKGFSIAQSLCKWSGICQTSQTIYAALDSKQILLALDLVCIQCHVYGQLILHTLKPCSLRRYTKPSSKLQKWGIKLPIWWGPEGPEFKMSEMNKCDAGILIIA